jgi:hypothetical protein
MAVATGSLRRRQNEEAKVAAKSKRDKMILAGGAAVLVAVLAFEVPKLMSSSSSSAPPPAVTPVATPGVATSVPGVVTPDEVRSDLKQIARLSAKDPFKAQLETGGSTAGTQQMGNAPAVRLKHFVSKNPFKAQLGEVTAAPVAPLATPVPVSSLAPVKHKKGAAAAAAPYGFIVILRSLDTKAAGKSELRKAHAKGLSTAALLFSSKYTTLRHGYWVLYLDKYPSAAQADAALQVAKSHGYDGAYRRPVRK